VTWYASTDQDGLKTETLLAIYKEPREPRSLVPALPPSGVIVVLRLPNGATSEIVVAESDGDAAKIKISDGSIWSIARLRNAELPYPPPDCPSSDDLRLVRRFEKGGSGSSGLKFKRPAADAASVGLRWLHA
jgi:hypothetical protein